MSRFGLNKLRRYAVRISYQYHKRNPTYHSTCLVDLWPVIFVGGSKTSGIKTDSEKLQRKQNKVEIGDNLVAELTPIEHMVKEGGTLVTNVFFKSGLMYLHGYLVGTNGSLCG